MYLAIEKYDMGCTQSGSGFFFLHIILLLVPLILVLEGEKRYEPL